jgi:ABC-type sugar transport system ATPase subunit
LMSSAADAIRISDDSIKLDARMSELTVGNRQVVEIARAVGAEPDVLLLDEPTAALDAREVDRLFEVIRSLRARGIGMIYVSHRLAELETIADRFVVMRDGAVVATHQEGVDRDRLVAEIVGRQLSARVPHALSGDTTAGDVELAVDLTTDGALRRLSFQGRKGQAIGLYGLPGSGVESVARAIVGDIATNGSIRIGGVKLGSRRTPRRCCRAGVAHVPADRGGEGMFPELSTRTNISIGALSMRSPWRYLSKSAEDDAARPLAKQADVRPPRLSATVGSLSGGNQQKVMFARWLATRPRVMILDQPTRGIDVGAKAQIYDLIDGVRSGGAVVVVISPEPDELMQVCDVIGVLHNGEIAGFHRVEDIEEEELVALAMTGR